MQPCHLKTEEKTQDVTPSKTFTRGHLNNTHTEIFDAGEAEAFSRLKFDDSLSTLQIRRRLREKRRRIVECDSFTIHLFQAVNANVGREYPGSMSLRN